MEIKTPSGSQSAGELSRLFSSQLQASPSAPDLQNQHDQNFTHTRMSSVASDDCSEHDRDECRFYNTDSAQSPLIPNVYEPFDRNELRDSRSPSPRPGSRTSRAMAQSSREASPHYRQSPFEKRPGPGQGFGYSDKRASSTSTTRVIHYAKSGRHSSRASTIPGPPISRKAVLNQQEQSPEFRDPEKRRQSHQASFENWQKAGDRLFAPSSRNRRR